jgi:hypothetical protein
MYRFNSGMGGVTCDDCDVLIDEGLGPKEYERFWGKGKDYCMRCKRKRDERNLLQAMPPPEARVGEHDDMAPREVRP